MRGVVMDMIVKEYTQYIDTCQNLVSTGISFVQYHSDIDRYLKTERRGPFNPLEYFCKVCRI